MSNKTKNILFVCSMAKIRSRTAANLFVCGDVQTDFAGTDTGADKPLTAEAVQWANKIICMESHHRSKVRRKHKGVSHKIITWNIPDNYSYMDPELVAVMRSKPLI